MSQNRNPVEELAALRAEMRRLKAREDALQEMFLAHGTAMPREGAEHVVEVVTRSRRTFDKRLLPADILSDERFYATFVNRVVALRPKHLPHPPQVADGRDDAEALH